MQPDTVTLKPFSRGNMFQINFNTIMLRTYFLVPINVYYYFYKSPVVIYNFDIFLCTEDYKELVFVQISKINEPAVSGTR